MRLRLLSALVVLVLLVLALHPPGREEDGRTSVTIRIPISLMPMFLVERDSTGRNDR